MQFSNERQLSITQEKIETLRRLTSELAELEKKQVSKMVIDLGLKKILLKDQRELNALSRFSLTSIFTFILGIRAKKFKEKKQKVLAAKLDVETSQQALNLIDQRVKEIQHKISSMADIDDKYKQLLKEKEHYLFEHNISISLEIHSILEKISTIKIEWEQVSETIKITDIVLAKIRKLQPILNGAENWAIYDMFGDGGVSKGVKYSKIDGAKKLIAQIQTYLTTLVNECKHIGIDYIVKKDITIKRFSKFIDIVYDGLVTGSDIKRKITKSKKNIKELEEDIFRIRRDLLHNKNKLEMDKIAYEHKYEALLCDSV
ncbi:hypothetical protein J8281_14955 [Aquimarina sp. U1-2]|uniref:hypothetical protein n=1 Tax=Aquimarina sp. U1-2 TaxID=2823141 RepID=UPI001AECCAA9|nr:hypothetical protein [Aquimarina sp. U1-2]MBP2833492.1 hypothetical protein [Aquimarina sp. U1-2]